MPTTIVPLEPLQGSTNIEATGYDAATRTLAVRFKSGATYHYRDVEPEIAGGLAEARSPGRFLYSTIRDAYAFERVDTERAEG